jgi:hypothetical protein
MVRRKDNGRFDFDGPLLPWTRDRVIHVIGDRDLYRTRYFRQPEGIKSMSVSIEQHRTTVSATVPSGHGGDGHAVEVVLNGYDVVSASCDGCKHG